MQSKEIVDDEQILFWLDKLGFIRGCDRANCCEWGRLMLFELAIKANAGFYNSHTEENFLFHFNLLRKDRTLNKRGREFICAMGYASSNGRAEVFKLINAYRK